MSDVVKLVFAEWDDPGADWRRDQTPGRLCFDATDDELVVRSDSDRRDGVCCRLSFVDPDCITCLLHPGAARDQGGSAGGVALRVTTRGLMV
jgi:hypothetical protein